MEKYKRYSKASLTAPGFLNNFSTAPIPSGWHCAISTLQLACVPCTQHWHQLQHRDRSWHVPQLAWHRGTELNYPGTEGVVVWYCERICSWPPKPCHLYGKRLERQKKKTPEHIVSPLMLTLSSYLKEDEEQTNRLCLARLTNKRCLRWQYGVSADVAYRFVLLREEINTGRH